MSKRRQQLPPTAASATITSSRRMQPARSSSPSSTPAAAAASTPATKRKRVTRAVNSDSIDNSSEDEAAAMATARTLRRRIVSKPFGGQSKVNPKAAPPVKRTRRARSAAQNEHTSDEESGAPTRKRPRRSSTTAARARSAKKAPAAKQKTKVTHQAASDKSDEESESDPSEIDSGSSDSSDEADAWQPGQDADMAGSESDSDADEVKAVTTPPVSLSFMDILLTTGAYPALQAAAIGLALNHPNFDVNQFHPVTGDSFLQVLYSVYTSGSVACREMRPLDQHRGHILALIKKADFSHRNAKGETILHTIMSDETYAHDLPINMRSRWALRRFRQNVADNEAAGLIVPLPIHRRVIKANSLFAGAVFRQCLKSGLDWMQPSATGQVPLLRLARLVEGGKFNHADVLRLLSSRAARKKLDLSVTDEQLNSPLHLLFQEQFNSVLVSRCVCNLSRALTKPSQARLLATADWYSANLEGRTISDLLQRASDYADAADAYRSAQQRNAAIDEQLRAAPTKLLAAWREAKLPTLKTALDRHLIKDLAAIVCEYVVGPEPPKVKSAKPEATPESGGDEEEKSAQPAAAAVVLDELMELAAAAASHSRTAPTARPTVVRPQRAAASRALATIHTQQRILRHGSDEPLVQQQAKPSSDSSPAAAVAPSSKRKRGTPKLVDEADEEEEAPTPIGWRSKKVANPSSQRVISHTRRASGRHAHFHDENDESSEEEGEQPVKSKPGSKAEKATRRAHVTSSEDEDVPSDSPAPKRIRSSSILAARTFQQPAKSSSGTGKVPKAARSDSDSDSDNDKSKSKTVAKDKIQAKSKSKSKKAVVPSSSDDSDSDESDESDSNSDAESSGDGGESAADDAGSEQSNEDSDHASEPSDNEDESYLPPGVKAPKPKKPKVASSRKKAAPQPLAPADPTPMMELLLSEGSYPALQIPAIALALNLPSFSVNQSHPVTGDSFMQVLYLAAYRQHVLTRWYYDRYAYGRLVESNKAAGLPPPPDTATVVATKSTSRLVHAIVRKCALHHHALALDWLEPDATGHVPVLGFARLVAEGKFQMRAFTRLMVARSTGRGFNLTVVDEHQATPIHLLLAPRVVDPDASPAQRRENRINRELDLLVGVLSRSTMKALLAPVDLHAPDDDGHTIADLLHQAVKAAPREVHSYYYRGREQLDTLPANLHHAWRKAKSPAIMSALDSHLIKDLASIVTAYLIGPTPRISKKKSAPPQKQFNLDDEKKAAHPAAAAANPGSFLSMLSQFSAAPMELDW